MGLSNNFVPQPPETIDLLIIIIIIILGYG